MDKMNCAKCGSNPVCGRPCDACCPEAAKAYDERMNKPLTIEDIQKAIKELPARSKPIVCPYCGKKDFGIKHLAECEQDHYNKRSNRELAKELVKGFKEIKNNPKEYITRSKLSKPDDSLLQQGNNNTREIIKVDDDGYFIFKESGDE